MKLYSTLIYAFLIIGMACCKPKGDEQISTDVVNLPISANGTDKSQLPVMTFKNSSFDFGTIKQGEKVTHAFPFTNTGKKDLIISTAHGSCGCTVPEYPKYPIKPGEAGIVNIIFNSEHKSGLQHKSVTILANTLPNSTEITLTGTVIAPDEKIKSNSQQ